MTDASLSLQGLERQSPPAAQPQTIRGVTAGVDRAAADLTTGLASALYERHSPQQDGHGYGLSVSFPSSQPQYDFVNWLRYDYAGIGLDFPADTRWDELLLDYYQGKCGE
jgi:hypothetical protein